MEDPNEYRNPADLGGHRTDKGSRRSRAGFMTEYWPPCPGYTRPQGPVRADVIKTDTTGSPTGFEVKIKVRTARGPGISTSTDGVEPAGSCWWRWDFGPARNIQGCDAEASPSSARFAVAPDDYLRRGRSHQDIRTSR